MEVYEELGPLEVARSDAHIVLLTGMVEFGEAPVNQSELTIGMVDHDVMRLDIAVHNALRVAEIERFENLKHVEANVEVIEALIQLAEVRIARVDKLSDDRRRLGQGVPHHIDQVDDIRAASERLQNFDLSSNLVLLDRLEYFDDDSLIRLCIDAFVHF